jgi:hypothetical protein
LWLETRGGTFVLDEDRRSITCDITNADLVPLTELELQRIATDLFLELRRYCAGRASPPSIDSRGCL